MLIIITTALLGAIAVVLYMWKVALEEKAAKKLQPAAAAAPAVDGTSGGSA
jgi:membrane protein required for beta-lactamase induction